MAKRKSRRGYGAVTLDGLHTAVTQSVKGTDVLVGAVAGLAGVAAAKWGYGKLTALLAQQQITLPDVVGDLVPAVGSALAGVALYVGQKQSAAGAGHLVGALAGGAAITAGGLAAKHGLPGFSDVVSVNLQGLVTRSFSAGATPQRIPARQALSLVTADPRRGMGLVAANPKPARPQQLGLVTANRRAALSRASGMSGVRSYDLP